jgi:pSer/pThr/pTyr-binding forkhead associated (FHA) protein
MARLCLLDENGLPAQQWEIGESPLSVGRGVEADIAVNDDAISSCHFLVCKQGDHWLLRDLQSSNGTWVDGHRTETATLHHHDCILAGHSLFMFHDHSPSAHFATQ